jgi:nucleoside deoxyribosyltransferase
MKIYLAAPFFSPDQVAVCAKIEKLAARFKAVSLYSPRHDGVLVSIPLAERKLHTKRIFYLNISHIADSAVMIAVVDGRDVGTTWEMGYYYRLKQSHPLLSLRLITYTDADYGLNVMIKESVDAHCRGMGELEEVMYGVVDNDRDVYKRFRRFDEAVT